MPWVTKRVRAVAITTFLITLALFVSAFIGVLNKTTGIQGVANQILVALTAFASFVFYRSVAGLKRIKENLELTQSEDIFKYVKKRQA
jgi:uncharacterized membrane protein